MGILVNQNQIGGGTSNSSHNIGDIFYTTRTDNSLNGAVECNGSQYNFSDFDSNLQSLLDNGKIASISIDKFDEMVAEQGGCDSFGYGTDTEWDKWDAMPGYVYTNTTPTAVGDPVYDSPGGNIIGHITRIDSEDRTCIYYDATDGTSGFGYADNWVYGPVEPTTYFKVPKKLGRVLVRSQKPTEDNNYTWYNVYSDGWVEQGGIKNANSSGGTTVTLLVTMNNTNYIVTATANETTNLSSAKITVALKTTTTFKLKIDITRNVGWQVSGYAISSEYAQSTWEYQNVQVERPMVQLFNSTTDTAVATCNQVLADVSALNQGDYVIETQIPTSENGYTWYRLYKSGWVEQGGFCSGTAENNPVTLAIEMKDTEYTIVATNMQTTAVDAWGWVVVSKDSKTTTGFSLGGRQGSGNTTPVRTNWQVSGMSAQGKK